MSFGQLVGLAGTDGKPRDFVSARSPTVMIKSLRKGVYVSTAADNGSITAWIDDQGKYRVALHRRLMTIDSQKFTNLKAVGAWWKTALRKIGDPNKEAVA